MTDEFIEYAKLHLISLEQDMQVLHSEDVVPYRQLEAAWSTTAHLLQVYSDIKYNGEKKG
jgi:hypothetical protein